MIDVKVERIDSGIPMPSYAYDGDAGMDLRSTEYVEVKPNERVLVGTGLRMAIPRGYYAAIVPRSGMAFKHGITVVNTPGTIDSKYRGEVKVAIHNVGDETYFINRRDRIAQIIFKKQEEANLMEVEDLDDTDRGEGGFGSSGY